MAAFVARTPSTGLFNGHECRVKFLRTCEVCASVADRYSDARHDGSTETCKGDACRGSRRTGKACLLIDSSVLLLGRPNGRTGATRGERGGSDQELWYGGKRVQPSLTSKLLSALLCGEVVSVAATPRLSSSSSSVAVSSG